MMCRGGGHWLVILLATGRIQPCLSHPPLPSKDQPDQDVVHLPGGGKIIPEHFNEGTAARETFERAVRDALSVPRAVVEKQRAANARTKPRRTKA